MSAPSPSNGSPLIITPLGGLGEVGMNLMVYEAEGRMIVVDAGVLFPDADMPGVDMVFADLAHLVANRDRLDAIFLTHGHEDHIGAVPFLLREFDVPIYGTPVTLALLEAKLREHELDKFARLRPVRVGESATAGPFTVEFIRVTHSIIDAAALAITTPAGVVVHTGDFKIDPTPVDGELFDAARLTALGDQGVLALLSDSTNAETPGHTHSESDVGRTLHQLFGEIRGRIILATFSSNIHRVQQVIDAARANRKKVAIVGRSMEQNTRITREMGYLKVPDGVVVPITDLPDRPDTEAVIVTTGSQGEPMSALFRMTMGEHKHVSLQPGDTVMLSSRTIPGNEVAIGRVINHLYRLGIRVIHARVSEIHVSGHAAREEQQKMIALTRPRYFIPIHGEWRMLANHAETARRVGVPAERVVVIENGDRLCLTHHTAKRLEPAPAGRTFVDGNALHDAGQLILRDRKTLSAGGILVVVIGIDMHAGKVLLGPELLNRGFLAEDHSDKLEPELRQVACEAIASLEREALSDPEAVRVRVRNRLRKHIERTLRRRPIVMPVVMEM
ncbi:MAG: ribonuclease J [Nitrospirae bacterium]|nr:ribonuclease J [Nitrospirota bacterium]